MVHASVRPDKKENYFHDLYLRRAIFKTYPKSVTSLFNLRIILSMKRKTNKRSCSLRLFEAKLFFVTIKVLLIA